MKTEKEYNSDIGKKIRYFRELAGISREELAQRLGYASKSSISKIENGVANIPVEKIFYFAKALGCEVAELTAPIREIDNDYIDEVIRRNAPAGNATEKLQHIMQILAQMSDEQINKADNILSTIFDT